MNCLLRKTFKAPAIFANASGCHQFLIFRTNGLIKQYTSSATHHREKNKNVQAYLLFRPGVTLCATNGLLQSGNQKMNESDEIEKPGTIRDAVWTFNGSAVLSINRFVISFNQHITVALVQHLYAHEAGNISLYFSL